MKITKLIYIIIFFLFFNCESFSQLSKKEYSEVVEYFVECIKTKNIEKLDSIITYPFNRPYPIPPINSKEELRERYTEIFDDSLSSLIINSDVQNDWSDVGWRGIMLHNGIVWLDYNGRLMSINHTSKKEQKIYDYWVEHERNLLHEKLKEFEYPIHTIETKNHIIRLDKVDDGRYRYASWDIDSKLSDKPNLILWNGELIPEGSGGNHHYIFRNGKYKYIIYVNIMKAEETPPFKLEISKNDKTILMQAAKLKKLKK